MYRVNIVKKILILFLLCFLNIISTNSNFNINNCTDVLIDNLRNLNILNYPNPFRYSGLGYNDLGKYEGCIKLLNSQYIALELIFWVTVPVKIKQQIYLGICLPSECGSKEILDKGKSYIMSLTSLSDENVLLINNSEEVKKAQNFDSVTIVTICFITVYFLIGSGIINYLINFLSSAKRKKTVCEQVDNNERNNENLLGNKINLNSLVEENNKNIFDKKNRFLNIFNFSENYDWLMNSNDDKEENEFRYMKSISVFLGCLYMVNQFIILLFHSPKRNVLTIFDAFQSSVLQIIFNSDFAIDTFIALCGMTLSFKIIKNYNFWKKSNIYFLLLEFFFILIKSWPIIILAFLVYWKIFPYVLNGPLSGYLYNMEGKSCDMQWSYIISLISNFTYGKWESSHPFCVSWYWYITLNTQLSFFGLLLCYFYVKKKTFFYPLFFLISFVLLLVEAWIILDNNFGVNIYEVNNSLDYFQKYYYKLYTRAFPYLMGIMFGISFGNYKIRKADENPKTLFDEIKISKVLSGFIMISGFILVLFLIVIVGWSFQENVWNSTTKFFYNFLCKKLFILGFIMFSLPLMLGNLCFIGKALNNPFMCRLSKIRDSAIIIFGFVCRFYLFEKRDYLFYSPLFSIMLGITFTVISYILGLYFTVLFEIPLIRMCDFIRNRNTIETNQRKNTFNNSIIDN